MDKVEAAASKDFLELMKLIKNPPKVLNKATHVPLTHVNDDKLNAHIGNMNAQGWELMTMAVEAIGIEERFIMFWRKVEIEPGK